MPSTRKGKLSASIEESHRQTGSRESESKSHSRHEEDPEMAGFGTETQHLFGSSGDEEPDTLDIVPMHEDGRLRLRADIAMEGPEYSGRKSSRKAAFEGNESDDNEHQSSEEERGEQDGRNANKTDGVQFGMSSDEDDERLMGGWQVGKGEDDELEVLNREYEELREQEEEMMKNLKGQGAEDHEKGEAVSHQKALWDRALETRIGLQKLVSGANRLPQGRAKEMFCKSDAQTQKAYSLLTKSAVRALDCLLDLERALLEQNSAITEAYAGSLNANGKREREEEEPEGKGVESPVNPVDAAWDRLNVLYSSIVPYRNNSVDRWQRKTQLSTGAAAVKGRLRAFNQSVTQQVAMAMRDPSRLIQRMRLQQSSSRILGKSAQPNSEKDARFEAGSAQVNGDIEVDDVDPESFDDSEFYQQLLQEFLDSSDPSTLGDMSLLSMRKLRNKKRKTVDRRASKGRKIRYTVHEPLVNFMAPEPMVLPPMASKLFANLFGQRTIAVSEPAS